MKQDELRHRLIDGTIHVIARDGLDKATTKQIGTFSVEQYFRKPKESDS